MKWKNSQMRRATYGNLLQVFVDAGHTEGAKALCEVLRKKCEDNVSRKYFVNSLAQIIAK